MIYSAMSFMWSVGINITSTILLETPEAVGGYGFGPRSVGFLYFTPLVAVALGEFFGHFFNDFIAKRYVMKHNGVFKPEARLLTNYIAAAFMIPGLIIVGQTLEKHLSYAGIIMGWGMYVFGVMLATVAITAYGKLIAAGNADRDDTDAYCSAGFLWLCQFGGLWSTEFRTRLIAPRHSTKLFNVLTTNTVISGFTVGYFQQPWGAKSGFGLSFGIQAIIVAIATAIVTFLQFYGGKLRAKGGPVV